MTLEESKEFIANLERLTAKSRRWCIAAIVLATVAVAINVVNIAVRLSTRCQPAVVGGAGK